MKRDKRLLLAMAVAAVAAAAVIAVFAAVGGAMVWSTLAQADRAAIDAVLGPTLALWGPFHLHHLPHLVLGDLVDHHLVPWRQ